MSGNVALRKREFFSSLGYEPHPGQVLVHRSKAPRRVLACGVRFGKSRCAAMEAIAALFEPRDGHIIGWTCAPTYDLAKRIFDDVVGTIHASLKHRILAFDDREHRIVVRNLGGGVSELRGKSADNPVSLLGAGIDFAIIDEAARMKAEVWERHVSQRLLDRKGWALLLSTPDGPGWFHKAFRRGQKGRDAMFESWSSPSWTNPHVDREFIDAERARLTDETFRQEYGGEFIGTETEPCDLCHGPDPSVPGVIVVDGYPTIPTCVECGRFVDENGFTRVQRWPDGKEYFHVIHLMQRDDTYPLLPFDSPESAAAYKAREASTVAVVLTGVDNP